MNTRFEMVEILEPIRLPSKDGAIHFNIPGQILMRFEPDGNIYIRDKLIENDKEVVEAMREWLRVNGVLK